MHEYMKMLHKAKNLVQDTELTWYDMTWGLMSNR